MGKVLWHTTMSLDGYIAGPGGTMDWMRGFSGPSPQTFQDIIASTGAALAGRNSYDSGANAGQKVYGGALKGPVFVLTHNPPEAGDPDVTFLTGDVADAVATAKKAADGKNVVLIGGILGKECLAAGLVDEILIHLAPVLVGDGVRLFDNPGGPSFRLTPLGAETEGDMVNLRYTPAG
ncbi:dihydrofolate reductase family protein [Catenulispora subtropica]|uniref:Dihydrofolate reductase family protein n=1 Tax=Catenulispora subtropica TaxID=450798 RepID=A0ABN2T6A9_9ACTN